jgi:hypothetical protein
MILPARRTPPPPAFGRIHLSLTTEELDAELGFMLKTCIRIRFLVPPLGGGGLGHAKSGGVRKALPDFNGYQEGDDCKSLPVGQGSTKNILVDSLKNYLMGFIPHRG